MNTSTFVTSRKELLDRTSPLPAYQQIANDIVLRISQQEWQIDDKLPSEAELAADYGVSRVTVRKAMLDLVQEGLLVRRQGKGTFVAEEKLRRDLSMITSFTDSCAARGHHAEARPISCQWEEATAEDCEKLGVSSEDRVLELCRLRLSDGDPVMLEVNRFPSEYAFLAEEPVTGSLYECLRAHGVIPSSAVHDISMGHATPFVSKHLHTEVGDALLVLDELVLNQHGEPLHLSRQWIRGDKFTFRI